MNEEILQRIANTLEVLVDGQQRIEAELQTLNSRFDQFLTGAHGSEHQGIHDRLVRIEKKLGIEVV